MKVRKRNFPAFSFFLVCSEVYTYVDQKTYTRIFLPTSSLFIIVPTANIQMSLNSRMDKNAVLCCCNGIPLSNGKNQTSAVPNTINKPHEHNVELEKADTKEYFLYEATLCRDSVHFWEEGLVAAMGY